MGYNDDRIQEYSDHLQKLWYFRAIDLLNVPDSIWRQLNLVHVFQESLFEMITKLQKSPSFKQYKESSDLQPSQHIKDLFNEFLEINTHQSATQDTQSIIQELDALCLLNVSKVKHYPFLPS